MAQDPHDPPSGKPPRPSGQRVLGEVRHSLDDLLHNELAPASAGGRPRARPDDDIPVLRVVEESTAANEPSADALARRIAVEVAARLNVEQKHAGKRPLPSPITARLAQLLAEALARHAPNMENTGPSARARRDRKD